MSEAVDQLINVLDEQGQETGEQKGYRAIHSDGNWHKSFHLWIIKEKKYILLQRRSEHKHLEPNKVGVSIASHFFTSETLLHIIDRIEQILGLKLELKDLQYFETRKVEMSYQDYVDREFQEVYLTFCDKALNSYYLNYQEAGVLYEVPIDKAIELYREKSYIAVAGFDAYQRENNALLIKDDLSEQARENTAKVLEKIKAYLDV